MHSSFGDKSGLYLLGMSSNTIAESTFGSEYKVIVVLVAISFQHSLFVTRTSVSSSTGQWDGEVHSRPIAEKEQQ